MYFLSFSVDPSPSPLSLCIGSSCSPQVGIVPRMLSLAQDLPAPVNLALSLHAPTQELRHSIVPAARAYPLPALMAALQHYQTQRCASHPSDRVP